MTLARCEQLQQEDQSSTALVKALLKEKRRRSGHMKPNTGPHTHTRGDMFSLRIAFIYIPDCTNAKYARESDPADALTGPSSRSWNNGRHEPPPWHLVSVCFEDSSKQGDFRFDTRARKTDPLRTQCEIGRVLIRRLFSHRRRHRRTKAAGDEATACEMMSSITLSPPATSRSSVELPRPERGHVCTDGSYTAIMMEK